MAEKRTIELEVDLKDNISETTEKTKSLKAQLREMKAQLANMDEGTEEFKKLTREAGKLQDKIGDISTGVKNFASDTRRLDATLQGINTVTNAFGAVEGSMALVGIESEDLQKTMVKLQAAMLIVNSVTEISNALQAESALMQTLNSAATKVAAVAQGAYALVVGTTTGALKAFRIALATTGIGAIVALLGMAASAMDLFGNSTEDAEAKQKELEKQLEKTNLEIERSSKLYEDLGKTVDTVSQQELINAKKRGASEEELNKIKSDGAKRRIDLVQEEVDEAQKRYLKYSKSGTAKQFEAAEKTYKEKSEKLTALKLQIEDEEASEIYDKRKENQQKLNDIRNSELEKIRENNRVALEENQARLRTEQEQEEFLVNQKFNEQIKLAKKYGKDTTQLEIDQANQINEIRLKYQEEDYKKKEEARQKELEAIKAANEKRIALEDEQFALQQSLNQTQKEKEIADLVKSYEDKFAVANGNAELEKQLTEQQKIDLGLIEDKYRKEKEAKDKEAAEKEIQAALAVQQQKAAIQQQGLDTALQGVQLIASVFEKQKGVQKAAVIAESAIGIAKMIISNKIANAGALASPANILVPGTAAPIIAMNNISTGIGIAANIAATAKALKTLGGGSPPPSPNPSGGGGGAGGGAMPPQFQTIGTSGVNQLATLQQQPTKAYVVSGEVTSAQSLDRNRVQNATL
jgi:hypothetical protein